MAWNAADFPELRHEALFGDRVVPCFADRPRHVHQLLADAAERDPDGEALVLADVRISWSEARREAERLARALAALGAGPGDRVALLMGNSPRMVLTLFAVARLGAVAVAVSTRSSAAEVGYILRDSEARLIVHDAALADRVPDGAPAHPADALAGDGPLPETPPDEEDTALILYTSGTTGRPKGAMLAHVNLIHAALFYEAALRIGAEDRIVVAVPLSHVTGIAALIATAVRAGAALILMPAFKAADFLDLAEAERMTYTLMVPAMYSLCLLRPDFPQRRLGTWRLAAYGGAPMPEPVIRRLAEAVPGLRFANCYGATETIVAQIITPPELGFERREFVGAALPGTRALVMGTDGREVPPGEPGELWLGGPNVVRGYWRNPEASAAAFQGGLWKSGDIGVADADGFFRVLDRSKDMINRGGLKIYSAELESVLTDHPAVAEAAVIARPCPVLGERVHAVIVTRAAVSEADLTERCRTLLSDYKVAESYTFTEEPLPRNANGKVDKTVLRDAILPGLPATGPS